MFALVWVFFMYLLMALYKKEYQPSWTSGLMQYTSFFSYTVGSCVSLLHMSHDRGCQDTVQCPQSLDVSQGSITIKKCISHCPVGQMGIPYSPCHEPTSFRVHLGCLWNWLLLACAPLISYFWNNTEAEKFASICTGQCLQSYDTQRVCGASCQC